MGDVADMDSTQKNNNGKQLPEESGWRCRELLEHVPAGGMILDRHGRLLHVNSTYCRMSGYERRELEEMALSDIDAENGPDEIAARFDRVHAGATELFETRHRRRDGTLFEAEISASLLYDNPARLICFCRDISRRKQAERSLAESESRYRTLYDWNPAGIGQVGLDFRLQHANPAFCRYLGYEERELIGMHLRDITHPDVLRENLARQNLLVRGTIDHFEMEKRFIRKDGTVVEGLMGAALVRDDRGQPAHTIGTVIDSTEYNRVRREKIKLQEQLSQAQKMESVGRLAGGVAHDYNNSLGVILGNVEMALEELDDHEDPLHDFLTEIKEAAQRSVEFTRQLLAFARRQAVTPQAIDLNQRVQGMLRMIQRLIGEDIYLHWAPGTGVWTVSIDPSQVDQILTNLCVNARDAIDGVGTITIQSGNVIFDAEHCVGRGDLSPGHYVMLEVCDSGSGVSPVVREHLFEPFFTTKGQGKGTGLGLATVYGIVTQNKGYVTVDSEEGRGTSFKIYLPRYSGTTRPSPGESKGATGAGGNETILLVEDEAAIRKVAGMVLKKLGYRVLAVATPEEALDMARTRDDAIDLLLTDVIMPEMNGQELATRMQMLRPGMKILFMSGYTANAISQQNIFHEQVNFIQKPFSSRAIAEKVREVLDGDG